jgi:hypothetical protein
LRQALDSHGTAPHELDGLVAVGLGGLLSQPEFSRTASLLPLVQLVEQMQVVAAVALVDFVQLLQQQVVAVL